MSSKNLKVCVALAAVCTAAMSAFSQEGESGSAPQLDTALQDEIRYAEALVDAALPDFAQPVIEAAKQKWPGPEADTSFFAIEIRAMISLGKQEEAEKRIAALPDRNGSKYWAARLEVANSFNQQGKKTECSNIYNEFFKKFPTPPKELKKFYHEASYAYGQILLGDKQLAKAAERYEGLLKQIDKGASDDDANTWCNVASETAEIYLRLAAEKPTPKDRTDLLNKAKVIVDQLLWEQDRPVFFGRAIAMLAHIELLRGSVEKAQSTIDDYMDQLAELHAQIKEVDPDGIYGLLKQSPMPQCRFMLAQILWDEAQKEYKAKPTKDNEKVKSLLFGAIVSGKKRNGQGAYNHALNVFVQYPESAWAAKAGDMEKAIAEFATEKFGATVKSKVTPEQMQRVRQMQFAAAYSMAAEGNYEESINDLLTTLGSYPEGKESIQAIESIINSYNTLMRDPRTKDSPKKADWRMDLDAIEGYLAERFAGNQNDTVMTLAGDAVIRAAGLEKSRGDLTRADQLQKAFFMNYRRHSNAPVMAASMAGELQTAEKWEDAIALWELFGKYYSKNHYYATSLSSLAYCYDKIGDTANAIQTLTKYIEAEENPLRKAQAQMNRAMTYQKTGFAMIDGAKTNENEQVAAEQEAKGCAQIIQGIKDFRAFAADADKKLADPGITANDKAKYSDLKEGALFLTGDSWRRLKKPAAKVELFRKNAADNLEEYVKQFPQGKYAAKSYVLLGTLYTAMGDVEKSKDALARLAQRFPDSPEAKDAMPRLAKSLIEMGMNKEATEIYRDMLKTDGNYTAWDFVRAGESLINAKSWLLADEAFNKAINLASTNLPTAVARARIGQAKSYYNQKDYISSREYIDKILEDPKLKNLSAAADANFLLVDVASAQGLTEKDTNLRKKHFAAAMGALKRLRTQYWAKKPQAERDSLDLMSAEIRIRRMNAEADMGFKEESKETGEQAAATLQAFLQAHQPVKEKAQVSTEGLSEEEAKALAEVAKNSQEKTFDELSAQEVKNLERAYTLLVPLLAKLGPEKGGFVLKFGSDYLATFPNGSARTEIRNAMQQAEAAGAVMPSEEEEKAAAESAAQETNKQENSTPVETIEVQEEPQDSEENQSEGE
ncbi:MAG: tetratricopeptide repeat protein [Kiritimatiellae bacterium]|nr:tetratricopeptide repeat protein [Kiritimatiellia bacterium]